MNSKLKFETATIYVHNNVVLRKLDGLIKGVEPITSLRQLRSFSDTTYTGTIGATWEGAKIPTELMGKILACIAEFPHTETIYILYYNAEDGKWLVKVPEQSGSGGSVRSYADTAGVAGYSLMGTIHTHPEMSGFWSGTDRGDQENHAGFHIVFGTHGGYPDTWRSTRFFKYIEEGETKEEANKRLSENLEKGEFGKDEPGLRELDLFSLVESLPKKEELPDPPADWMEILKRQTVPVQAAPNSHFPECKPLYKYTPKLGTDVETPWTVLSTHTTPSLGVEQRVDPAIVEISKAREALYEAVQTLSLLIDEEDLAKEVNSALYQTGGSLAISCADACRSFENSLEVLLDNDPDSVFAVLESYGILQDAEDMALLDAQAQKEQDTAEEIEADQFYKSLYI